MSLHLIEYLAEADSGDKASSTALLATGVGLVALATLVGAWLARRRAGQRQLWFGAAAGALLVIALLHLVPDAWAGAKDAGLPAWLVPLIAVVSFAVTVAVSRAGCACEADEEHASGAGSAGALAVHRFLEGAALALTGLVTAVALAVHALGEGLAVGALLRTQPRRLAGWLAVMSIGPAIGAIAADAIPALLIAEPLLLAVAAGVLAQAARISLRAAFQHRRSGMRVMTAPAAAIVVSAAVTALAVYGVG
jgi:zinc transporter ZupT